VDFTNSDLYVDIRKYQKTGKGSAKVKRIADDVEELLKLSPKHDGEIHRGITFDPADYENFAKNLEPGKTIDMRGMSSWSGKKDMANNYGSASGKEGVIFTIKKPKTAVGIAHLSTYQAEDEVLMSDKAQYRVVSSQRKKTTTTGVMKQKRMITYVELEEIA
jgi:hypothetical protein